MNLEPLLFADAIISGDHHLTDLGSYQGIPIFSTREALTMVS
ncbi:MAG TPA: hypothetical protein VFK31_03840 [Rhodanobacteraceae bacterium]|nr:hypothetical protein [Rhodanobacteraceae bacterium]